ncbi:AraC family transcriptional regulator [Paenibacillus xerothermodurans]|uniref:AraC family transcriptional regulator n=1 Tax=Paenibacillus xerothermodurans TaxID=1977292 RepID=A0A2W1NEH2_PAEXE|nr:AraC family transcriptional regulator [Paenibacillus xerothermodurans]PZE22334.1 AraC family transcriptional regulator [Paenibacillus xerothermodurans]
MNNTHRAFWKKYIAKAKLDLSIAAYTKVPTTWQDCDYISEFNKFYFVTEGEGFVKIRDREYYPQPGELYLLPAGIKQSYGTISQDTFGKYWCHFTAKIGELHLFNVVQTPACIKVKDPDELRKKFEQLIYYSHSDELTSEFRVNSILIDFIAGFIEQSGSVRLNLASEPAFEKMNKVLKYIEDNLARNISVDELARIAHFHPNYFINIFKHVTGYPPIQYVNRMRSEKAKNLLIMTELNVSQIADSVGMELSYFSRMFREHTGLSPTAYREMIPRTTV